MNFQAQNARELVETLRVTGGSYSAGCHHALLGHNPYIAAVYMIWPNEINARYKRMFVYCEKCWERVPTPLHTDMTGIPLAAMLIEAVFPE